MTEIEMVNVTSGSTYRYKRNVVPDRYVEGVLPLITSERIFDLPFPEWQGWSVTMIDHAPTHAIFDLRLDNIVLTYNNVCFDDTSADAMWHDAIIKPPIVVAKQAPKTPPWMAVGMAVGIVKIMQTKPFSMALAPSIELTMAFALLAAR